MHMSAGAQNLSLLTPRTKVAVSVGQHRIQLAITPNPLVHFRAVHDFVDTGLGLRFRLWGLGFGV